MRILVYKGKHGYEYWMADTPERAAGARAELFEMLDQDGCYEYGVHDKLLLLAREGCPASIVNILHNRNGYEYETWSYEEAKVIE